MPGGIHSPSAVVTAWRNAGRISSANQGLRRSQAVVHQEGCGKGKRRGRKGTKVADIVGHGTAAEDVGQGVGADEQGEADVRHQRPEPGVPEWHTFGARRGIATVGKAAGIAQSHGQDRDPGFVVEGVAIHLEPGAKTIAGRVVERQSGLVDLGAGGLAHDQQARLGGGAEDGAGAERQVSGADAAGTDLGGQGG